MTKYKAKLIDEALEQYFGADDLVEYLKALLQKQLDHAAPADEIELPLGEMPYGFDTNEQVDIARLFCARYELHLIGVKRTPTSATVTISLVEPWPDED